MDVMLKGLVGGILTAIIALASKRGNVLPGVLPLAPTFAIIALLAVGSKGDVDGFRIACLAGVKTIPAYLAFLLSAYFLSGMADFRLAIAGGLAIWLIVALAIFLIPACSNVHCPPMSPRMYRYLSSTALLVLSAAPADSEDRASPAIVITAPGDPTDVEALTAEDIRGSGRPDLRR